jgi:hypothetical protein
MRLHVLAVLCALFAGSAQAQSMRDTTLTDAPFCFARNYDAAHLADHPDQRVTAITISQHREIPQNAADGMVLLVRVMLRGTNEVWSGAAYCQVGKMADCGMEGDSGTFAIEPREGDSILLSVGRYGITFEGQSDFITLHSDRGDDRSFLLRRAALSACQ